MAGGDWTPLALWSAVLASGAYHGLNPAMGWPLAVSAGLMERRPRALLAALAWLALGHLAAMLAMILPFALLVALLSWQREIQLAASLAMLAWGTVLLARRRHPRLLARISPARLGLWAFAVAIAHGAGLMLLPAYLGLCRPDPHHAAAGRLMGTSLDMALAVSAVHAVAMTAVGGLLAWLVYRYFGLKLLARSWFNLDALWAASLILLGGLSLAANAATP